jgi:hypothetical protein
MIHHQVTIAALLLALMIAPQATWAGDVASSVLPAFLPGGTADQAAKTGYVTNPTGGIDAINLETGELLWATKESGRPLVASDNRLAARTNVQGKANSVRILVFDKTGKRLLQSDSVIFPDWVSVELTHGRSFDAHAEIAKSNLLLHWQAHAFYAGGAPPPPEVVKAAKKDATGTARINLQSGKVEMLKAMNPARPRLPKELEKVTSRQYWTGSNWETKPLLAGQTLATLDQQALPNGKQKLTLKRWDLKTGKALDTVVLLEGKELWPRVQADGRFLFVHQALVKDQLPAGDYAWWIFSVESGKQVGKVPFEQVGQDMAVIGPRLFSVVSIAAKKPPRFPTTVPQALRALNLQTGKMWERPIEPKRRLLPLP